ncbi:MAG: hypothetical protein V1495_11335 [Pseudomonadota bacterium]
MKSLPIVLLLSFLLITPANAQEVTVQPTNAQTNASRRGFFLGLGLGGGGISFLSSTDSMSKGAGIGSLRIGGGINDKLLLMGESFAAVTSWGGTDYLSVSSFCLSAQYFFMEGFYGRSGLGMAVSRLDTNMGGVGVSMESKVGFSMLAATGYEFRLVKFFALAPEIEANYARVNGENVLSYGIQLAALFYL